MNLNGAIIRVRLYKTSAERRATRCGYAHEVWPKSSPFACWYCRQFFSGPPLMLPRSRSPGMVWELEGNICSGYKGVSCGLRYLLDGPQTFATSTRVALFIQLVKQIFPDFEKHMNGRIPLGVDYREYEMFGGDTTVEEARAISLQPDVIVQMRYPPHVNTVIGVSETYFGSLHGGRGEREILRAIASETRNQKERGAGSPEGRLDEEEGEAEAEAESEAKADSLEGLDARTQRRLAAYKVQRETFDVENLRVPTRDEIADRIVQKPKRLDNVGSFEELAFGIGSTTSHQEKEHVEEETQAKKKGRGRKKAV
jgi:hypothetical protein